MTGTRNRRVPGPRAFPSLCGDALHPAASSLENRRDVFVPYDQVHAEAVAAATRLAEAGAGDAGIRIEVPHNDLTTGPLPAAARCNTEGVGKQ